MGENQLADLEYFRPQMFPIEVEVPQQQGARGRGQISLNDRPFTLRMITHQIVFNTMPTSSVQEVQDGLYRIDWSIFQQHRYWKGVSPMADTAFGSIRHGIWKPLEVPLVIPGTETLHIEIINTVDRPDPFVVEVIFHGIEDINPKHRKL